MTARHDGRAGLLHRAGRCAVALAAMAAMISVLALAPPQALAQELTTEACLDAHRASQKLRKDGKLSAARGKLLICVKHACPEPVRLECAGWMNEIDKQIPTIVVAAKDAGGQDTIDVRVMIDDVKVVDTIDGRPLAVDPGPHKLSCEHRGELRELEIVVQQGIKSRPVTCDFTAAPTSPSPAPAPVTSEPGKGAASTPPDKSPAAGQTDRGVPIAAYTFGGLSLAAFASFIAFGVVGKNEADDLRDSCGENAPPPLTKTCSDDQVDPVRAKLIAADVSLGVGVALAAVSVGLFLHHYLREPESPGAAIRVDFGPARGGALGQLTVAF